METFKSIVRWDTSNASFYELENKQWIFKKEVEGRWWWIGSEIEYTMKYDELKKREIIDKIINVKKWEERLLFWNDYFKNFSDLANSLSIDYFEKNIKMDLLKINSASSLRNVFETYLKIYVKDDFDIEIEILFAKIAYQEKRKSQRWTILPEWFSKFLRKIFEENLSRNKDDFKRFLEVFVAYNKYFNPSAK